MSRVTTAGPLLALAFVLAPGAARAQGVALVHDATVYLDAKEAPLKAPEGVACSDTQVVVADTGNQRLLTYALRDARLAGGNEIKLTQLTTPVRVQLGPKGAIYALDSRTRKIVKVSPAGAFEGTLEPKGIEDASKVVVGAFKLDANGNAYLLDVAGRRVLVLDGAGAVTRQVTIPKDAGTIMDIAVDLAGTIYGVDAVSASVWSADKSGTELKSLTPSMKDRMNFPVYIAAHKGRLFLVDQNGNGVVVLGADGSFQGRQLAVGWSDGLVYYPQQLCLTDSGSAYLADRYNNRVQAFTFGK